MCHPSVLEWVSKTLTLDDVFDRSVIEVGALNVNGSVRPMIEEMGARTYLGTDVQMGPGVNHVIDAATLPRIYGMERFELVISTEMLEHADDWRAALRAMAVILAPRGLLVLTTRSPGFPYHYPPDHWRFPVDLLGAAIEALGLDIIELTPDPQYPGVFCKATKQTAGLPPSRHALDRLEAQAITVTGGIAT
jgi:hypothetical protein